MSTKADRNTILDALEDEYRHDLAIHLYSSFLLHSINPLFPKKNWASWPLPSQEVPDPRTTTKYIDSIDFGKQFPKDIGAEILKFTHDDTRDTEVSFERDTLEPEGGISSDEDDTSEVNEEYVENNIQNIDARQVMKIKTVFFQENLSNSKADLMNELLALIERIILNRLKPVHSGDISISESTRNLTMRLSQQLANRINDTFDNILEMQKSSTLKASAKRPFLRLLNWQDVLMACSNAHDSNDVKSDYSVYDKCQYLFGESRYKYDYDDDDVIDNDEDHNEESIDRSNVTDDSIEFKKKRSFDLVEYLGEVERSNSSNAIYKDFNRNLLRRKSEIKKLEEMKRKLFHRKLELHTKTNELSWDKRTTKKSTHKKRFPINTQNREFAKELALHHGGIHLDEDEYIIN